MPVVWREKSLCLLLLFVLLLLLLLHRLLRDEWNKWPIFDQNDLWDLVEECDDDEMDACRERFEIMRSKVEWML